MSLLDLPSNVLLAISAYLSPSSLRSLHAANQRLCTLLTPVLHSLATQPSFAPIALHYAASHRNEALVRHILSAPANLHIHGTPLHGEPLIPLLLNPTHTPRLVITDRSLYATPLHWAARHGSATVTRTLLARGVGVNAAARNGGTALGWAAYNGSPEVIRMLLDAGADYTLKDHAGLRPLHYALAKGRKGAIELLEEASKKKI